MAINSRFYRMILILILGSIAMGACTTSPAPKPTATAPGGFPAGTYKPDHPLSATELMFSPQGTFELMLTDEVRVGSYVVNGDQIVVNLNDGPCVNHPGTYQWKIHGDTLTLKPINETCTASMSGRGADLAGRSWIRQP